MEMVKSNCLLGVPASRQGRNVMWELLILIISHTMYVKEFFTNTLLNQRLKNNNTISCNIWSLIGQVPNG